MSGIFTREQSPAEVVRAVTARASLRWQELSEQDRALGVAKLLLAGVYDDRQDGYFMLRTRMPGGRIDADQLNAVAAVVADFARRPGGEDGPDRFAEITTRQDLQIHGQFVTVWKDQGPFARAGGERQCGHCRIPMTTRRPSWRRPRVSWSWAAGSAVWRRRTSCADRRVRPDPR